MANTDPIEWRLIQTDLKSVRAILPAVDGTLALELNEPGSGSLQIPADSTTATMVESRTGQFIAAYYRGAYRGGFFVDDVETINASSGEGGGQWVKITGRGLLAFLSEAVVWTEDKTTTKTTRLFEEKSMGETLITLIDEAQDRLAIQALAYDFTATHDSNGDAWTDSGDHEFTVGCSLLDIVRDFGGLGLEFTTTLETDGTITLSAWQAAIGTDLSNTVYLRTGGSVTKNSFNRKGAEMKNAYIIKYNGGYTSVRGTYGGNRRREFLYHADEAKSSSLARSFAAADLAESEQGKTEIEIGTYDNLKPFAFIDYGIGDWIMVDDAGDEAKYRVRGMNLSWKGDREYADIALTLSSVFKEKAIRVAIETERLRVLITRMHDMDMLEVMKWVSLFDLTPTMFTGTSINCIAQYGTSLYLGGEFTRIGGIAANNIVMFNMKTQVWTALGTGLTEEQEDESGGYGLGPVCRAILVDGDDMYATGAFIKAGGVTCNGIAKWDGSNWTALAGGLGWHHATWGNDGGMSLAKYGTDIIVGGVFQISAAGGYADWAEESTIKCIAAWNGAAYSALGDGVNAWNPICALLVDGATMYIGGEFIAVEDEDIVCLATWDGSNWGMLGATPFTGSVRALALRSTDLIIGGYFVTAPGGTEVNHICSWDGSDFSSLGDGFTLEDPEIRFEYVQGISVYMTDIYAVGSFIETDKGLAVNGVAQWNGADKWIALNLGLTGGPLCCLAVNGNLYVGGVLTGAGNDEATDVPGTFLEWITSFEDLLDHINNPGGAVWGQIGGNIDEQLDLIAELNKKVDIAQGGGSGNRVLVTSAAGAIQVDAKLRWNNADSELILGSGSDSPPVPFGGASHIVGDGYSGAQFVYAHGTGVAPFWRGVRTRGTETVPTAIKDDDVILRLRGSGHNGTAYSGTQSEIRVVADGDWAVGDHPTRIELYTTPDSSDVLTLAMTVGSDQIIYDKDGNPITASHAAVTLDVNADTLLSLTGQELGLDTQAANTVFAGPVSGADAVPTPRVLVEDDIPDLSGTYEPVDATIMREGDALDLLDSGAATLNQVPLAQGDGTIVWGDQTGGGASIPLLTSDPVAPADGELWLLRLTSGGHADGEAMGPLGLTYTGDVGGDLPLKLSVNDDGITRRLQFS